MVNEYKAVLNKLLHAAVWKANNHVSFIDEAFCCHHPSSAGGFLCLCHRTTDQLKGTRREKCTY